MYVIRAGLAIVAEVSNAKGPALLGALRLDQKMFNLQNFGFNIFFQI